MELREREEAKSAVRKLIEEIRYHDYRYYVLDSPVISDTEYDQLIAELRVLEERFPDLKSPDSPTMRVSGQVELGTVEHPIPMLSLKSAYEEEDVRNFDKNCCKELNQEKVEYVAEPKYDGLAIELIYRQEGQQDGQQDRQQDSRISRLVLASTRGDGQTGEDVTANIKTIREITSILQSREGAPPPPFYLVVRGEVYMRKDEFRRLNQQRAEAGESLFANPRNAAAGSLRQLDPKVTARRPLHIFLYEVVQSEGYEFQTHWEVLHTLPKWGLKVDAAHVQLYSRLEDALSFHQRLEENRDKLPYDLDGVVFKVNRLADRERLGFRTHDPRWALAYKFAPRQMTSRVRDIKVQVGRTGMLTPVAVLEPVHIGGVEVSSASLHNQSEIERKDIRLGDSVLVERAGDVIPYVVMSIKELRDGSEQVFHFPENCPVCGSKVVMSEDKKAALCTGMTCPAQIRKRILHFASKGGMDIDGLGEKMAEHLVDLGLLRRLSSIYQLRREDLLSMERMGGKSTDNLMRAIENSKDRTLSRFLFSLGIPLVGEHLARVLAEHFATIDDLMRITQGISEKTSKETIKEPPKESSKEPPKKIAEENLQQIEEIGPAVAHSIISFFADQENRTVIEEMLKAGLTLRNPLYRMENVRQPLSGLNFVFSGKLEQWTREQAKRLVESMGGRAASSVSKETDYLVAGPGAGSKLDEAKKLSIPIMSEAEFAGFLEERQR